MLAHLHPQPPSFVRCGLLSPLLRSCSDLRCFTRILHIRIYLFLTTPLQDPLMLHTWMWYPLCNIPLPYTSVRLISSRLYTIASIIIDIVTPTSIYIPLFQRSTFPSQHRDVLLSTPFSSSRSLLGTLSLSIYCFPVK